MTQIQFDNKYPQAKLLKCVNVELATGVFAILGLYDNGLVQQMWKDPFDKARFCDIDCREYYAMLED